MTDGNDSRVETKQVSAGLITNICFWVDFAATKTRRVCGEAYKDVRPYCLPPSTLMTNTPEYTPIAVIPNVR
jgi:hypothetical protein